MLSSLPENTNLLMGLSFSAINVVGLEAGFAPAFWSVCFLLRALRARRASLTWCRNSWVINKYIYSTTSIWRRARRLTKFVRYLPRFRYIEVLFHTFHYYWGEEKYARYAEDFIIWRFVINKLLFVKETHCSNTWYI